MLYLYVDGEFVGGRVVDAVAGVKHERVHGRLLVLVLGLDVADGRAVDQVHHRERADLASCLFLINSRIYFELKI
jgi:hypothetical protein